MYSHAPVKVHDITVMSKSRVSPYFCHSCRVKPVGNPLEKKEKIPDKT